MCSIILDVLVIKNRFLCIYKQNQNYHQNGNKAFIAQNVWSPYYEPFSIKEI